MSPFMALLAAAALGVAVSLAQGRGQILLVVILVLIVCSLPPVLIFPVLAALLLPAFLHEWRRTRRLARLDAFLPPFLENLAHTVRSGVSLEQAFRHTLPPGQGPLSPLADEVLHRLGMGQTFEVALGQAAALHDTALTRRFADAVELARQGGVDVSRLVENLARQSRDEAAAASRLSSLSAQGRLQTWVLALLPPAILLLLQGLDPERVQRFFAHPTGKLILCGMALLEAVGILWMRRLTRV